MIGRMIQDLRKRMIQDFRKRSQKKKIQEVLNKELEDKKSK